MSIGALTVYDDVPWVERPDEAEKAARLDAHLPVNRPLLRDRSFFERKSLPELAWSFALFRPDVIPQAASGWRAEMTGGASSL